MAPETEVSKKVTLDVTVRVRPQIQVIAEKLCVHVGGAKWRTLLESQEPGQHGADLDASVWNGGKGRNPIRTFRSSHLLSAQLPLRIAGTTAGERGGFGEVMLAVKERRGRTSVTVPARQMSDGMLRMLAIARVCCGSRRDWLR